MKEMKWKWMEWSRARWGPRTEKYSTYYFVLSLFLFFCNSFLLFCFYIDVIFCVKEHECQSCGK
jgi:hypothetical protein